MNATLTMFFIMDRSACCSSAVYGSTVGDGVGSSLGPGVAGAAVGDGEPACTGKNDAGLLRRLL